MEEIIINMKVLIAILLLSAALAVKITWFTKENSADDGMACDQYYEFEKMGEKRTAIVFEKRAYEKDDMWT